MNRFILAHDPWDIPELMCDQHIVKMVTEEAQMLCHAVREYMPQFAAQHDAGLFKSMSAGHAKHPCTVWACATKTNFEWALDLFYHMAYEYSARFGREHGTQSRVGHLLLQVVTSDEFADEFPDGGLTPHPQCFGDLHDQCVTDEAWPVNAYNTYYRLKQTTFKRPMRWTQTGEAA